MDKPEKVTTLKEIKDNIERFNREAKTSIKDIKISNVQYWVYDTDKSQFAPCKFVQCIGTTFPLYNKWMRIQKKKESFGSFGGGRDAHERIEQITKKQFNKNDQLRNKLKNWANHQLGIQVSSFYKSGNKKGKDKWKFLEL